MSSSDEDISSPTDLDPRIFKRILNMPFYTSLGDIDLLELMEKRKLTKDEKDVAKLKRDESEIEDAGTLFQFIKRVAKLKEEYKYKNKTYSDQVSETVKLLHNWEDTGWDRIDEHRKVGDLLGEKMRLKEAKKRLAYSKTLSRRLGSRSLAPDDIELFKKILASKKKKKKSKKKSKKKKSKKKS